MKDFDIIRATTADEDRVFEFLIKNFYKDEPLNNSVNYLGPLDKKDCVSPIALRDNLSLLVVRKDDPTIICAAAINRVIEPVNAEDIWTDLVKDHHGTPYGDILKFLQIATTEFAKRLKEECFEKTNTNKAVETTMIAVRTENRGHQLGLHLINKTIELVKSQNYRFMTMECSSAFSAALCKKLEYKSLLEIPYKDYKDDQGNIVFNTKEPHKAFVSFVKDLQED